MCGSMCPPALAKLLGRHRGKDGKRGKRPETFLTAYEMEQLPVMVREVERANRHFWQMVCWRWSRREEKAGKTTPTDQRSPKKSVERSSEPSAVRQQQQQRPKGCPDDSYTDGCALRELVRLLATTMSEKGTFDAEAEQMINDFRARILGHHRGGARQFGRENTAKESKAEKRRREFMKLRAISFNGALGDMEQPKEQAKTSSSSTSASSSASSGYSSSEPPAANKDRKSRASSWLRQRAHSVRDRRAGRCHCCADNDRLARLGEQLDSEFHSTVFAHPTEFDVHERELKTLVWRRFTQMLVAVWTDRDRFGGEEKQRG